MSTWNQLTITRTDGKSIKVDKLRAKLEKLGLDMFTSGDGEALNFTQIPGPDNGPMVDDPAEVTMSDWSKYSWGIDNDFGEISEKLGTKYTVNLVQEWDDEGPGGSDDTWTGGVHQDADSFAMRYVPDNLKEVLDRAIESPTQGAAAILQALNDLVEVAKRIRS